MNAIVVVTQTTQMSYEVIKTWLHTVGDEYNSINPNSTLTPRVVQY